LLALRAGTENPFVTKHKPSFWRHPMDTLTIFVTQLILSIVVFSLLAKWYVVPWLADKPIHLALIALTFPHALRHLGLAFLVPGLVAEPLPSSFALPVAYGDFVSGLLAIFALVALRRRWGFAIPLVWLFNFVGTADLLHALSRADAVPYLLTTWYIPTFWVPVLLVTHTMIFVRLFKHAFQRSNSHVGSTPVLSPVRK
jgi:hypothetical protein